jgi:septal ring factor EnvC (AmiA/AmiB activator)
MNTMFTPAILSLFVPVIASIAGALIGWFLGRRKHKAEADLLQLQNLEELIKIWQNMAKDIKKEYEELKKENKHLIAQIEELEKKMDALNDENDKLLKALKDLKKQLGKS